MRWATDLWFRIRAVFARAAMQRDLEDEVDFHIEMEARKLEAGGVSRAEALRVARVHFGGEDRFKESARESWGVGIVTDLGGDVRFAARQLRKHPAFSTLAVLTLALGIGGTVALFSVVNGLMLRPLPIQDEDRVVAFWMDYNWRGEEFDYVKEYATAYESLTAFSNEAYTLRTDEATSLVLASVSTVELFDVLGASAFLGRTFRPGEDRPGAEPVVVLAHGIWQREFGGDRDIVGRQINLDGRSTTVIGVMPERFYFPTPEYELFLPLNMDPDDPQYSNNGWLVLAGRLRPGVTDAGVRDNLEVITGALDERYDYPDAWDKTRSPYVTPIREYLLGEIRPALLLLLGAVGLLLVMACANVSALILTKTADRTKEMSVRAALGAGSARLARQALTETILLGLIAGVVGVALATGLFDLLTASLPIDPSFRQTLSIDWVALSAALGLAVCAGAVIALAPIRNLLRGELARGGLSERTQSASAAHSSRLQSGLVIAEVLLAVVLVTGTSLLVRTVDGLRSLDLGLDPEGVMTVAVLVSEEEVDRSERVAFFEALLERASALPGAQSAGFINRLPLRDGGWQGPVSVPDRPDLTGPSRPNAMYRPVTPQTFDALGARLIEGRGIRDTDLADGPFVSVINESFARRMWGDESPLGRTYRSGFLGVSNEVEVVGVVRDISLVDMVGPQPMAAYYAWKQSMEGRGSGILLVRGTGEASALGPPLRALIRELEPRAAIGRMQTMEDALDSEMAEPLRLRFFLGLFSVLGMVMGTVGVYGVVSYSVRRRQTEFGVRMALGAEPRLLLGAVLRQGMLPVALGVVAGTAAALVATRTLAQFLFGVEPTDPVSFLVAGAALLATGVVAAVIPALRATTTEPAVALREG